MNNRLRSSTRKRTELQSKHIKKFKFRGSESDDGAISFSQGFYYNKKTRSVNNQTTTNNISPGTRKRKMASSSESTKPFSKAAKMDLAEEIQVQIDDQIRMREGAMKLMSASSTLNQALETSKNLLTINARILGLMSALQRKKQERVLQEYNRQRSSTVSESPDEACSGRIAISDMRIPLMWRDNVHFTGKTGDQSYYAFALIRCGDQVRDTPLYEITSSDTDMYFDLTIIFDDLKPDFKMEFEVYYTVITSNEAHGVRPPRPTMNIRAQKKQIQFKAPKFCLAGHVHINIDNVRSGIVSKDLTMGGQGASGVAVLGDLHEFPVHPLELWGQICFQLAAQPVDMKREIHQGHISVEINSPANKYYCILRQDSLHCWDCMEHVMSSKPLHSIKLTSETKVSQVQSADINSVKLLVEESVVATLIFNSSSDCFEWKNSIRHQINNILSWKFAFEEEMYIEEMKKNRLSIPSTASFYDQIKIEEITSIVNLNNISYNGKGIVNEAFNTPPPPSSHTPSSLDNIENTPPHQQLTNGSINNEHLNNTTTTSQQNGKQEICEKVCENTSETVPSSTSVEMTDEQDPGQPALLLQNGHPPPSTLPEDENETKPSVSVDNNDDNVKKNIDEDKSSLPSEDEKVVEESDATSGDVEKSDEKVELNIENVEEVEMEVDSNEEKTESNAEKDVSKVENVEKIESDAEIVISKVENVGEIESNAEIVELKVEKVESNTENVESSDVENVESKVEKVESDVEIVESNVESKVEKVESNVESNVELKTESVDIEMFDDSSPDIQLESNDEKSENPEPQSDIIKTKPENDETKTENIEAKTENIEAEPENTESKPENVESNPENTEIKPENVESNPENTEIKPENVDSEPKEEVETTPENGEIKSENGEIKPDILDSENTEEQEPSNNIENSIEQSQQKEDTKQIEEESAKNENSQLCENLEKESKLDDQEESGC